jgi:predicted lactoylglutathione lyase
MRMIFPNLPVKDVAASRAFFGALGFGINEMFSTDDTVSVVIEENITVMLLQEERFRTFIENEIADRDTTEVLLALSCDSKDEVVDLVAKAKAAGATDWKAPMEESFMYGHSFRDLDGHVWELMWMDVEAAGGAGGAEAEGAAA